jgi:hypothetical protein
MLTHGVVLTQLLLVVTVWFAGKFGKKPLVFVTIVLLFSSLIHVMTPDVFVLQMTVVVTTAAVQYHKIREHEVGEMLTTFRNLLDRLSGR